MGVSKEFYESFTKTYEPCTLFHGIKDRNSEKFSNQGLSAYLTLNLTDFENSIISFFSRRHYSCSFFKNICLSMGNYR